VPVKLVCQLTVELIGFATGEMNNQRRRLRLGSGIGGRTVVGACALPCFDGGRCERGRIFRKRDLRKVENTIADPDHAEVFHETMR